MCVVIPGLSADSDRETGSVLFLEKLMILSKTSLIGKTLGIRQGRMLHNIHLYCEGVQEKESHIISF